MNHLWKNKFYNLINQIATEIQKKRMVQKSFAFRILLVTDSYLLITKNSRFELHLHYNAS